MAGKDEESGKSLKSEIEVQQEEILSIKKGCESVRGFLMDLNQRGREGLAGESCDAIEELRNDLLNFLKVDGNAVSGGRELKKESFNSENVKDESKMLSRKKGDRSGYGESYDSGGSTSTEVSSKLSCGARRKEKKRDNLRSSMNENAHRNKYKSCRRLPQCEASVDDFINDAGDM